MKTILITGINGYLGSRLAKALSSHYNIIGVEYSLNNLYRITGCNYKVYSISDVASELIFTENYIDIILHAATFYGNNNEDYIQMLNSNLLSPVNLLDKSIQFGCKLFINTDTVLDRFVSTYALTKRQFQEWLYLRKDAIKVVNMQLEHFYGPCADPVNFITAMIYKLKNNEPQIALTQGEQERDFIFIDDVVNAFLTIIDKQDLITAPYTSFQVCTNHLISIKNLVKMIKYLTQSHSILNFGEIPYRENELMYSTSDNATLRDLGWNPIYTINEGLKITVANCKDSEDFRPQKTIK